MLSKTNSSGAMESSHWLKARIPICDCAWCNIESLLGTWITFFSRSLLAKHLHVHGKVLDRSHYCILNLDHSHHLARCAHLESMNHTIEVCRQRRNISCGSNCWDEWVGVPSVSFTLWLEASHVIMQLAIKTQVPPHRWVFRHRIATSTTSTLSCFSIYTPDVPRLVSIVELLIISCSLSCWRTKATAGIVTIDSLELLNTGHDLIQLGMAVHSRLTRIWLSDHKINHQSSSHFFSLFYLQNFLFRRAYADGYVLGLTWIVPSLIIFYIVNIMTKSALQKTLLVPCLRLRWLWNSGSVCACWNS